MVAPTSKSLRLFLCCDNNSFFSLLEIARISSSLSTQAPLTRRRLSWRSRSRPYNALNSSAAAAFSLLSFSRSPCSLMLSSIQSRSAESFIFSIRDSYLSSMHFFDATNILFSCVRHLFSSTTAGYACHTLNSSSSFWIMGIATLPLPSSPIK